MRARLAYLLSRYPKTSETFVVDEIAALARRGVEVEVAALRPGRSDVATGDAPRAAAVAGPGAILFAQLVWAVRAPRRLVAVWWSACSQHRHAPRALAQAALAVAAASALALRFERRGVRHVHAHFATHAALAAWAIRRLVGISYSFTAHADDIFVRRPMLAEKVAASAFTVTISDYNRRFLGETLGATAAERIRVVHCGVDTEVFAPLAPAPQRGPFTILCVGRLEEKKGQRHLIEACRLLAARGVSLRCVLVGEGRERGALERAREAAGLGDRVVLLGAQPRERIRALLAEAHAFVLPSVVTAEGRAEGIPVALMEAMAMQRPVVSTRIAGIPELIEDGRSGLLVEPGDAGALADALARLHGDAARATAMAREARGVVCARFDLRQNAAHLAALFARCDGADEVRGPLAFEAPPGVEGAAR